MDTSNQEPNTEEVKGTPIVPDQVSEWGNDLNFIEPGAKDEQGNDMRTEPEENAETEEVEETTDNAPVVDDQPIVQSTLEDPGEYEPNDYSFEITIYDEEGKNGKPVKVKSIEEWEDLLDKDANFGSPSALLKAQRMATKMESNADRDFSEWKKRKDAFDKQVSDNEQFQDNVQSLVNQVQYLIERGDMPKIPEKFNNVDWGKSEAAQKDPDVKAHLDLIAYRDKENAKRVKLGLPSMSMLEAFATMQLDGTRKRAEDAKKKAAEARKTAGARVAGSSPAPASIAPKGIAVGRGGNLNDLGAGWGA